MICDMCPSITMPLFKRLPRSDPGATDPHWRLGPRLLQLLRCHGWQRGSCLGCHGFPWFPPGDLAFKGGKKPSETSTGGWYPLISMSNHFKIEGSSFCLGLPRLTFEGRNAREPTVSLLRRRCHLWTLVGGLGPCHSDTHDSL